jgi:hypothetical protein
MLVWIRTPFAAVPPDVRKASDFPVTSCPTNRGYAPDRWGIAPDKRDNFQDGPETVLTSGGKAAKTPSAQTLSDSALCNQMIGSRCSN